MGQRYRSAFVTALLLTASLPSNAQQGVDQSCRIGLRPTMDAILELPLGTDRDVAEQVAIRKTDGYCGCLVQTIPVASLSSDDMRYVHYLLKEALTERGEFEQQLHLAWNGLDEAKMGPMSFRMFEWVMKCRRAGDT